MLGLVWSSCTNEESIVNPATEGQTAALRTEEEAIALAENLNAALDVDGARSSRKIVKGVDIIGSSNSRAGSDTLIYAVNYEDNAGYVLVSAAKQGIGVIGYTDEGNFDAEAAEENPNFSYYLDAAKNYVSTQKISVGGPVIDPSTPQTLQQVVFPNVIVEWGQSYPEGMYCPNKLSGCVQTAMAQMMTVIGKPTSIALSYDGKDVNSQNLNWAELLTHKKSINSDTQFMVNNHLSSCGASVEIHKAIGRLCRQLGHLNYANYKESATGAVSYTAYNTFKSLCPNNEFTGFKSFNSTFGNLWDDLNKKTGVAYVDGYDPSAGGHAWVCDGGTHLITTYKLLKEDGSYETVEKHDYYYHFNWGWSGRDNGNFNAGVFDNKNPRSRYNFAIDPAYFVVYK